MLKKVQIYVFMLVLAGLTIPAFAANHYVDKNAAGSNNGSSWSNAWESFGAISWSSVSPGDVIYISGGNDSTIYNETLTVGKSGTAGSRIVISNSTESGHNGKVIIDGGNSRANGINISNVSYITVRNITLRNSVQGLVAISHSNYIIVDNCVMSVYGRAGVHIQYSTGSEIKNNRIETGSYVNTQTDGIYSQYNTSTVYDHNYIVVNNNEPTGHDDCIQSFQDNNLTVHSNYCEQNNNKTSNAQGIYATTPAGGVFRYYNNVVNLGTSQSNGMSFRKLTGTGTVEIIGNTLYGMTAYSLFYITETSDPVIKNNIIYSDGSSYAARLVNWSGNPSNIDNNIIYVPNSTNVWSFNGVSKTWNQWKALGFDVHGKNVDPKFKNKTGKDFSLQSTSPAVDEGSTAGNPYNQDIMGVTRPQGQGYDAGAYEFNGGNPNPDTTPPEVTAATISNQTTVVVSFSEALQVSGAQNPANYTISGGITVSSAVMNGTQVTLTTSIHIAGQSYVVTVNNVKDLAGNLINPNANTAGYSFFDDTTPPELVGASISGSARVVAVFSEEMDPATIGNKNNYAISNGVTVISAIVFNNNQKVILITSEQNMGSWYTLTVNNVKDLAGNLINPNHRTADYQAEKKVKDDIIIANGQWYQNFDPGKAIDGNADTTSQSRWGGVANLPDSIIFDMGSVNRINETRLSFYRWNDGRSYTYSIMTSSDGIKWEDAASNCSTAPTEWTIDNFTAVDARYVKLVILGCNESPVAGLWEAEIYGPTEVTGIENGNEVPSDFSLEQNYPNPFNPTTTINFNIPSDQQVKINIYNSIGQLVTELVNKEYSAGNHAVEFNAANLPSGVYIYRMEAKSFTATHKMVLMK